MHVFITGGTGLIGTAVIAELLGAGHVVTALARSDASTQKLRDAGATPLAGSLTDLDVLRTGAEAADGVIHLAFSNDFSSPEALARGIAEETAALGLLSDVLVGSEHPLVTVSGTPAIPGRASTEDDPLPPDGPVAGRSASVNRALGLADEGVRATAVRLPRTVHNHGNGGFAGILARFARQAGVVGYPGDGSQRWPAVHALDAAALFRLVLEAAPAGTSWHAVADEGDRVLDIAEAIGRRLDLPTQSLPVDSFGPLGPAFAMDQPSSSAYTREALGWAPTRSSLLADLENLRL